MRIWMCRAAHRSTGKPPLGGPGLREVQTAMRRNKGVSESRPEQWLMSPCHRPKSRTLVLRPPPVAAKQASLSSGSHHWPWSSHCNWIRWTLLGTPGKQGPDSRMDFRRGSGTEALKRYKLGKDINTHKKEKWETVEYSQFCQLQWWRRDRCQAPHREPIRVIRLLVSAGSRLNAVTDVAGKRWQTFSGDCCWRV